MHLVTSLILIFILISKLNTSTIVVSTYNLWNVMFNWELRKLRISKMIKENNPDVIAFQEVRCSNDQEINQIKDLQNLLPGYKWLFFKPSNGIQKQKNSLHNEYEKEGIGILSKLPIVSAKSAELPYKYGPDTNKRLLLHVKLQQEDNFINIINVHFSYDRQQQCGNAAAVLDYIFSKRLRNVVILGDFNTYKDFESPIELITFKTGQVLEGCKHEQKEIGNRFISFVDSWQKLYGKDQTSGLTFSNMPSPGLESRPDRIITSSDMEVIDSTLSGRGTTYRSQYSSSIVLYRFKTVLNHASLSYHSYEGYSCLQDCGPHGSCRCGVCVAVGNEQNCNLPHCDECNADIYRNYVILLCVAILIAIHFFYAILSILITGADFRGDSVFTILGFNCCLCNPDLYKKPILLSRRSKLIKICNQWPLFKLPPCYLLFISGVSIIFVYISAKVIFSRTLKSINSVLDEEFFPSDHLMLTVKIKTLLSYIFFWY